MQEELNVWSGPDALKRFLKLEGYPTLPMVEVTCLFPELQKDKVRIFAKLMYLLPLLQSKMIPVLKIFQVAEERGDLKNVSVVVENTSGNTGISIAPIARVVYGILRTLLIVPKNISASKRKMLGVIGAEVQEMEEGSNETGIQRAKRLGGEEGGFCVKQYDDVANVQGHVEITAEEIWMQLEQEGLSDGPCLISAGEGTGGHALGCREYLRAKNPRIKIIGAISPEDDDGIDGMRSLKRLRETTLGGEQVDFLMEVRTAAAKCRSKMLAVNGIFAGKSSGAALEALLGTLKRQKELGRLDGFRNHNGEVVGVFICTDTCLPYLEEY